MYAQSPEIDWLERLEEWADQCTDLTASMETRIDQLDTEGISANWLERFSDIRQRAKEIREQLAAEETSDVVTNMVTLDAEARELDASVRPFIEGDSASDAAETPEEEREDAQALED